MEYSLYFEDSQRCCRGWIGVEATELFRVGPLGSKAWPGGQRFVRGAWKLYGLSVRA
jgi:hypothetical protein